jgi:hypothetical protein
MPLSSIEEEDMAGKASSYVMNTHGQINGETVQQWTQDWVTWWLQAPATTNPQFDTTGAYANVDNNNGKMFFLAGNFGGDSTRTFTAPANEPLLVPILDSPALQWNGTDFNGVVDHQTFGKGAGNKSVTDWQKGVSASDLFLSINGASVDVTQSDFIKTSWFSSGPAQPDSFAQALVDAHVLYPGGVDIGPNKNVGYWAVIAGQPAGSTMTLDFGGSTGGFAVGVHDTITFV